jgi:hypothetical protein
VSETLKLPLADATGRSQRWPSREFGLSQAAISKRAAREGWQRPVITPVITPTDNQLDNHSDNRMGGPDRAERLLAAAGPVRRNRAPQIAD